MRRVGKPGRLGRNAGNSTSKLGLNVTLEEVASAPLPEASQDQVGVAKASELGQNEVEEIYARLPPIQTDQADQKDFFVRDKTVVPPKSGELVKAEFPPKEETEQRPPEALLQELKKQEAEDLHVVRATPQGVLQSSHSTFTITFSQPMVAVSSIAELEAQTVPIELSPLPQGGKFKWIGTKTLLFESAYRFPNSTKFTVRVPQGTKSASGNTTKKEFTFEFSTPTIQLENRYPSSYAFPLNELPFVWLRFNQEIEPTAVAKTISIHSNTSNINFKPLQASEVEAELKEAKLRPSLESYRKSWQALFERTRSDGATAQELFLRLLTPVPSGQTVTIDVGPGVPSREGPLVSSEKVKHEVKNYDPLKVNDHHGDIRPLHDLVLSFNNELDATTFDAKRDLKVTPEIENMKVKVRHSSILIGGKTAAETKYQVHLSTQFLDVFGQHLPKEQTVTLGVGNASKTFHCFQTGVTVLDPTKPPTLSFATVNVTDFTLKLTQATPEEFSPGIFWAENRTLKGKTSTVHITVANFAPNKVCETQVPIKSYLMHADEGLGHLFVEAHVKKDKYGEEFKNTTWVQATRLGLAAISLGGDDIFVWCSSLLDGSPVKGAKVLSQQTGDDGLVHFQSKQNLFPEGVVIATHGNDSAFKQDCYAGYSQGSSTVAHIFSDRGLYKPKETASVRGLVRHLQVDGISYKAVLPAFKELNYEVFDSQWQSFGKGQVQISATGSFSLEITFPDNINLGHATLQFNAGEFNTSVSLKVEEFRTPEYEVKCSVDPRPYVVNTSAVVSTKASYYSGGGLSGANVYYSVTQENSTYSPPNWSEFQFQEHKPRYWCWFPHIDESCGVAANFEGKTNESGEHFLKVSFAETERAVKRPVTLTVESQVQDINRQTISGSTKFLVHPSSLYVGLAFDKSFLKPTEGGHVKLIVTDVDGKPVKDALVKLKIESIEYDWDKGENVNVLVKEEAVVSTDKPVLYPFKSDKGGYFKFSVSVQDEKGRTNQSSDFLTVFGKSFGSASNDTTPLIIPDKQEYEVGDEARVSLQVPFKAQAGFYFISCNRNESHGRLNFTPESSAEIVVPIKKNYIPNVHVWFGVVGHNLQDGQPKVAFGTGSVSLKVSSNSKKLQVDVLSIPEIAAPGSKVEVVVGVKDFQGHPVPKTEVCLVGVDEAVLSLIGHQISDPLPIFTPDHFCQAQVQFSHDLLSYPDWSKVQIEEPIQHHHCMRCCCKSCAYACAPSCCCCECACCACDSGVAVGGVAPQPIKVRSNFNPLAIFTPSSFTEQDGKVKIGFTLPDNLTRYRLTAVASADLDRFGIGESSLTAQLPVSIRPSIPRFLNFGDRSFFSCVLVNQTPSDLLIHVAARSSLVEMRGARGFALQLTPNQRAEVKFPVEAERVGVARFQVGAVVKDGAAFADAAEKSLPVYTPATGEAFATYGDFDEQSVARQPVQPPVDVWPQFGELRVSTSSTALQALTDGFLYLYNYPFECSEQLASKIIPVLALKDVLKEFKVVDLPSDEKIESFISENLKKIYKAQSHDGAFSFWVGGEPHAYTTVHVGHCLARVKLAGYTVSPQTLLSLCGALKVIEKFVRYEVSKEALRPLRAYAYYVLCLLGEVEEAGKLALELVKEVKEITSLDLESLCFIGHVFHASAGLKSPADLQGLNTLQAWNNKHFPQDSKLHYLAVILKHFNTCVKETAETAVFVTSFGDDHLSKLLYFHSNNRTDAIVLDLLLHVAPADDLLSKVCKGLLAHRKKGRWNNTQENAWALIALNKYFRTREAVTPDFISRVWFGEQFAGEHTFKGRTAETHQIDIPVSYLVKDTNKKDILVSREGKGRLYYRVGLSYAPKAGLKAIDYGFLVERSYNAVKDSSHVKTDGNGGYLIQAGELVRVKIRLTVTSVRYHVALVDHIPAGFEILNPDLKSTPSIPVDESGDSTSGGARCWWQGPWYEYQNLRDDRAEAFTTRLSCGTYTYSFVCRATSLGKYVVPPAHAEEMYSPELFGRSDAIVVTIQ